MAKVKVTKKQEKINKNIDELKKRELASIESIKKSVSECIDHLYSKKSFYIILIGSDGLDDKIITPCYVSSVYVSDSKSIYLTVEFIVNGVKNKTIAPFYEIEVANEKDDSILVGVCKTEDDCKKIYNHFLDLKIKNINSYKMKIG